MARAADRLVECLAAQGLDRLFCVPGESYLALLDALHGQNAIDLVTCRHEGGAGFMAVADAKLTGRPGGLAVSRGPGATNASIAIHAAQQDAVPLVVLIGQVARHERGRGAFQEVDYAITFADMAKAVWEVTEAGRLPDIVARAFRLAATPTPGPVVIVLPEDMLEDATEAPVVVLPAAPPPEPAEAEVERVRELLKGAKRPLLIAGGTLARERGRRALAAAAAAHGVPVACTFKFQHIFDNGSPLFAGHLGFKIPRRQVEALAEADLVLAVGTRLGDVPTQGYRFPQAPEPRQPLVQVHPDPAQLGRNHRCTLALACDPAALLEALAAAPDPAGASARQDWAAGLNAIAQAPRRGQPRAMPDGLDFGAVVAPLAARAPHDTIVTTDAGNFSGWVHGHWRWDGTQEAIGCVGGAMGIGVPGAVAAALRFPERPVIGFVGDGGLLMTGSELATAVACGAKPKVVVSSNGGYGTIRLHQERAYPARLAATQLANPDFALWARSFGLESWSVATEAEIEPAVEAFLAAEGPALLEVKSSMEAISPYATIAQLRGG